MTRMKSILAGLAGAMLVLFGLGLMTGQSPAPVKAQSRAAVSECAYDSDCTLVPANRFCVSGACVPAACVTDWDCSPGKHCERHFIDAAGHDTGIDRTGPASKARGSAAGAPLRWEVGPGEIQYCVADGPAGATLATSPSLRVDAPAVHLEPGTNRAGGDFATVPMADDDTAQACLQACQGNAACKAFTYVRAGIQGPHPMCYLKNAAPRAVKDNCCTSAVVRP